MVSTHDAYLHVISGGYNDATRKRVRKLFQEVPDDDDEPPHNTNDYDLIVGAIEEIHAVGVKNFTSDHIGKILEIFGVIKLAEKVLWHPKVARSYVERALGVMAIPRHENVYTTPKPEQLEALRRQHCFEAREAERKEGMSDA
jgi:DNA replicative helicase MCM subunit Mcm2 (Cdc46/Mcm family)